MGAGASVIADIESAKRYSAEECRDVLGELFDEAAFNAEKGDDKCVSGAQIMEQLGATVTSDTPVKADGEAEAAEGEGGGGDDGDYNDLLSYVDACLAMSHEERESVAHVVLESAEEREASQKKDAEKNSKASDYSKSFSGSAADTKAEKEFGNMMSGNDQPQEADPTDSRDSPLLPVITQDNVPSNKYQALREAGKWLKIMGAAGCFIYIHSLTHELLSLRPADFEEEQKEEKKEFDPAQGLDSCLMTEVPDFVNSCVDDDKMTPLLVDSSGDEGLLMTFYSYKGMVCDISALGLPLGQQRKLKIKPKEVMENLRKTAVNAIKAGDTLAINLGNIGGDVKFQSLCKRDVFPIEMFQEAGKKILTPSFPAPRCAKMFRDEDKDNGEVMWKDKFRMVLITTLAPTEVKNDLPNALPMEHIKTVYVKRQN